MLEKVDFIRLGSKGLPRNLLLEFPDTALHECYALFRLEQDIPVPAFQGIQLALKFR